MTTEDVAVASSDKILKILPAIQNYDWGKFGSESLVANFAKASSVEAIANEQPYAEVSRLSFIILILVYLFLAVDGNARQWALLACGS